MKKRLGVNIDHVATISNARGEIYPQPFKAAIIAEKSGANSITIHLREDVTEKSVRDWLPHALEEGEWKYKAVKVYGTDIEAIDIDSAKHKWIKDFR